LVSLGDSSIFFHSLTAKVLWIIIVVLLAQPLLAHFKDKRERIKAMRNE